MEAMFVTCEVFQLPISWLNAVAPRNMSVKLCTCEVSQVPTAPLNAAAPRNMFPMCVTCEVSHAEMSALKSALSLNSCDMSVTSDTSHSGISTQPALPHRAELGSAQFASVEQHASPLGTAERQASTAALSAALSGNAHIVSPEVGSSPAALISPPPHGTHHPDCARSSLRHGLWTHTLDGPRTEAVSPSMRRMRASHASAW